MRAPALDDANTHEKRKDLKDSSAYYVARSHAGTGSGVLLHGSFVASKQCEAFVGHFGSAIAGVIYSAMCMGHNGTLGICPPTFNMNHYESLKIHLAPASNQWNNNSSNLFLEECVRHRYDSDCLISVLKLNYFAYSFTLSEEANRIDCSPWYR